MNQSKITQTKKKSASRSASKPSAIKNSTARKAPPAAPNVAPEPEVVAAIVTEGDIHEMPVEAIPDALIAPSETNDEIDDEAIAYEAEIDSPVEPLVEPAAELATEQEEIELPPSISSWDETATLFQPENSSISGDADEDAAAEEDGDAEPLVQRNVPDQNIAPAASAEDGVNLAPVTEIKFESEVGINPPTQKAKGINRQLRSVSPRYAAACAEVGRLRKDFIHALNEKAELLGVKRIGEAVPVRNYDINAIDAEIREARQKLENLMQRKRQLKGISPELDTVNQTIRNLSRKRQAARLEKKAAFEDAMEAQSLVERDPFATA